MKGLYDFFFVRLPLRFLKKKVVVGIGENIPGRNKRALVYFKTDPMFSRSLREAYVHTNNAEIIAMVGIFNRLGFVVDLVDRNADWSQIAPLMEHCYDVYLANTAGNSAPLHKEINARIKARYRVFFAAGPEPEASDRLVEARHAGFDRRNGGHSIRRRLVENQTI